MLPLRLLLQLLLPTQISLLPPAIATIATRLGTRHSLARRHLAAARQWAAHSDVARWRRAAAQARALAETTLRIETRRRQGEARRALRAWRRAHSAAWLVCLEAARAYAAARLLHAHFGPWRREAAARAAERDAALRKASAFRRWWIGASVQRGVGSCTTTVTL